MTLIDSNGTKRAIPSSDLVLHDSIFAQSTPAEAAADGDLKPDVYIPFGYFIALIAGIMCAVLAAMSQFPFRIYVLTELY